MIYYKTYIIHPMHRPDMRPYSARFTQAHFDEVVYKGGAELHMDCRGLEEQLARALIEDWNRKSSTTRYTLGDGVHVGEARIEPATQQQTQQKASPDTQVLYFTRSMGRSGGIRYLSSSERGEIYDETGRFCGRTMRTGRAQLKLTPDRLITAEEFYAATGW